MARIIFLLLLIPGLAVGDSSRLDLEPIPDLSTLEPVHHIDRDTEYSRRTSYGIAGNIGIGYGSHDDKNGLVGEGAVLLGFRTRQFVASAASELVAGANSLVRGRHVGFLELRTDSANNDEDDIGGHGSLRVEVEHGEARALAPVYLGPGKRNHAAAETDVLIGLEPDKDDVIWAALVHADGSATKWLDAPLLDNAYRGAFGLGVSIAPNEEDEIPRGRIDLIRARVEHATIRRGFSAAATGPQRDTQVRTVEVMAGMHEFAGHIDHEMLMAFTVQFGGVWIETDAGAQDTLGKVEIAGHLKWRRSRVGRREFGFALARQPGTTPDGQHIVKDWRLEMIGGAEDRHFAITARGGISWVNHVAGLENDPDTVKRYGSHLELFAKLPLSLEVGGYHSMSYEPRVAGDPWSSKREWASEFGLLARWRPSTY